MTRILSLTEASELYIKYTREGLKELSFSDLEAMVTFMFLRIARLEHDNMRLRIQLDKIK